MNPILITLLSVMLVSCHQKQAASQPADSADLNVGGPCEGCEAIFESTIPFAQLNETDTLPDFNQPGPKLLLTGIIYQRDTKTPAPNVVLYIYHTDQAGIYPTPPDAKGWGKRHGSIRGWIKTNQKGEYRFYTLVPASYPNSTNPKHIHPVVKEPGKTAYWIDEYLFSNDPLLPEKEKNKKNPVGGDGVTNLVNENGIWRARRDIILGLNVSNYR